MRSSGFLGNGRSVTKFPRARCTVGADNAEGEAGRQGWTLEGEVFSLAEREMVGARGVSWGI